MRGLDKNFKTDGLPNSLFSGILYHSMERTLILCKPDCMRKNLAGEVVLRFQNAGLRLQAAKMIRLTDALLTEHYSHLTDKPFFPEIVNFMKSEPVLALILRVRMQ